MAPRRTNIVWERQSAGDDLGADTFGTSVARHLRHLLELSDELRTSRLAYLITRYVVGDNPGRTLAAHFCKPDFLEGALNRPENFELHAHKVYQPAAVPTVNSWIRWRTGLVSIDNKPAQACITVAQDLNTLAEAANDARFSSTDVETFYATLPNEADTVLHLYLRER